MILVLFVRQYLTYSFRTLVKLKPAVAKPKGKKEKTKYLSFPLLGKENPKND
jgi:hypothetical protein